MRRVGRGGAGGGASAVHVAAAHGPRATRGASGRLESACTRCGRRGPPSSRGAQTRLRRAWARLGARGAGAVQGGGFAAARAVPAAAGRAGAGGDEMAKSPAMAHPMRPQPTTPIRSSCGSCTRAMTCCSRKGRFWLWWQQHHLRKSWRALSSVGPAENVLLFLEARADLAELEQRAAPTALLQKPESAFM